MPRLRPFPGERRVWATAPRKTPAATPTKLRRIYDKVLQSPLLTGLLRIRNSSRTAKRERDGEMARRQADRSFPKSRAPKTAGLDRKIEDRKIRFSCPQFSCPKFPICGRREFAGNPCPPDGPETRTEMAPVEPSLPNRIPIRLPLFVCQNPSDPQPSRASRFGDNVFPEPTPAPPAPALRSRPSPQQSLPAPNPFRCNLSPCKRRLGTPRATGSQPVRFCSPAMNKLESRCGVNTPFQTCCYTGQP